MLHAFMERLDQKLSFGRVSAHCDIPCKIYDPVHAQIAVLTMIRMIDLLNELPEEDLTKQQKATFARLIEQKEEHGKKLKEEIRIIWGDYFKQPQLDQFPEIHSLTHEIMMLASVVKQESDKDAALKLLDKVNQFAEIFWATKGVKTFTADCPYLPELPTVYPDLKP
ncbi:superoxide dismutase, Ni [Grimontia sp. NTOU-MAR1]|uniref:superoxide dismutase, Ni n=1 Tax=Grimontia sp. NTOU-MAR1 TaxID=3111011 RepID=UPI002DBC61F9|nr:superoxide dismutase, Ni [Grimontia sp. NTOU-MAR1]WRV97934.1 superoxide dismutase, Ni [Grimontia sp. NTOU-MAR1]